MSNTQIWVFGILAFIVLLALVSRLTRGNAPWPVKANEERQYKKLVETAQASQEKVERHVTELREDVTEIKDRLQSIEQLLRAVD